MVYSYRILNDFFSSYLYRIPSEMDYLGWLEGKKKNNTIKYPVNIKFGFICWCHFLPLPLIFFSQNTSCENK